MLKRNIFFIVSFGLLPYVDAIALGNLYFADSTLINPDFNQVKDSVLAVKDTLTFNQGISSDTTKTDTMVLDSSDAGLKSEVKYSAKDSIKFDIPSRKVYLYKDAKINYESMNLKADYIIIDWNTNTIFAEGITDSTGKITGKPVFKDEDQEYQCHKMTYNFQTKKGKILNVVTQEGEGYIHGEQVKKSEADEFYVKDGKYTTCNDYENPHFHIAMSKLKVIPDDKIVTGPAYLVVENVPTPLALPFGIFPNKKGQASGILMPYYGESGELGFYLRNGGYYFAVSNSLGLELRGDIYTKGSWLMKTRGNYKKRYRFGGEFDLSYSIRNLGEKGSSDFSQTKDFFIRWSHAQDSKARPHSSFSANVNAGSSTFLQNNSYDTDDYLTNQLQSSVSYSWRKKLYGFTANARHSQNTQTRMVNLGLPEVAFNVSRFNPLKRKSAIGSQRWFESVGLSYTMNARNDVNFIDTTLFVYPSGMKSETQGASTNKQFNTQLLSELKNGMRHSIPISMSSLKLFKYINVSPSAGYSERWYIKTINKHWDNESLTLKTDTVNGFKRSMDFSGSLNASTSLFGMYNFKNKKVIAIRHVMTPNLSFSYHPDFGSPSLGYYHDVQADTFGNTHRYSIFEGGVYGGPSDGKSGSVGLSFNNTLEMKVRTKKDSINPIKKIKILEYFKFGSAYNLAADSFNLSNINFDGGTKLFNKIDLRFSGIIDPYAINEEGTHINKFEWNENKRIGRLNTFNVTLGMNLYPKPAKNENNKTDKKTERLADPYAEYYKNYFIPWTLNTNYSLNFRNDFVNDTLIISQSLNFNGTIQLTRNWKIGFNSGYDFDDKDFTYTSVNISRELHCWEMKFNWIPFGFRKSYEFSLNVKSTVLQDLKLHRRRDWYDN